MSILRKEIVWQPKDLKKPYIADYLADAVSDIVDEECAIGSMAYIRGTGKVNVKIADEKAASDWNEV